MNLLHTAYLPSYREKIKGKKYKKFAFLVDFPTFMAETKQPSANNNFKLTFFSAKLILFAQFAKQFRWGEIAITYYNYYNLKGLFWIMD